MPALIIAAVGAAATAYSAYSSSQASAKQSKQADKALGQSDREAEFNYKLGQEQLALSKKEHELTREQYEWLRQQYGEDKQYNLNWALEDLQRRLSAAGAAGERLSAADTYEWNERQRQVETEAINRQLALQEHDQAMGYLDYNQQMALQERLYDEQRLSMLEGKAADVGTQLKQALQSMGSFTQRPEYTEADVASREQDILKSYMSAADRAADRIASVNEAKDIARGMDTSTTGAMSRRQILREQVNPLYEEAMNKARSEALSQISGLSTMQSQYATNEREQREQQWSQMSDAIQAELNAIKDLSVTKQAGDYNAPVTPNTAARDAGTFVRGYNETIANPVQTYGANSGISPASYNPSSFNTNLGSNINSNAAEQGAAWAQSAAKSNAAATSSWMDAISNAYGAYQDYTKQQKQKAADLEAYNQWEAKQW